MNIITRLRNKLNKRIPELNQWLPTPQGEDKIVWLQNPNEFFYVRTRIFYSSKREGKPKGITGTLLLGYSTLEPNQKRNWSRFFERRYFYLQAKDLKADCVYLKRDCHPAEGVTPASIKPGIWGVHLQPHNWPMLSMRGGRE